MNFETIKTAQESIIARIAKSQDPGDLLKLTQSVLNLSHAYATIWSCDQAELEKD